jgi:hypothetical protein
MTAQQVTLEMYKAIINKNKQEEKRLWLKALKMSLNHKNTVAIL